MNNDAAPPSHASEDTPAHLRTATAVMLLTGMTMPALADEPCQSPYMAKITGEEEFVYVWTLGVKGRGDGSDKLVTIDVRKTSPTFGRCMMAMDIFVAVFT